MDCGLFHAYSTLYYLWRSCMIGWLPRCLETLNTYFPFPATLLEWPCCLDHWTASSMFSSYFLSRTPIITLFICPRSPLKSYLMHYSPFYYFHPIFIYHPLIYYCSHFIYFLLIDYFLNVIDLVLLLFGGDLPFEPVEAGILDGCRWSGGEIFVG